MTSFGSSTSLARKINLIIHLSISMVSKSYQSPFRNTWALYWRQPYLLPSRCMRKSKKKISILASLENFLPTYLSKPLIKCTRPSSDHNWTIVMSSITKQLRSLERVKSLLHWWMKLREFNTEGPLPLLELGKGLIVPSYMMNWVENRFLTAGRNSVLFYFIKLSTILLHLTWETNFHLYIIHSPP